MWTSSFFFFRSNLPIRCNTEHLSSICFGQIEPPCLKYKFSEVRVCVLAGAITDDDLLAFTAVVRSMDRLDEVDLGGNSLLTL